MTNTQLKAQIDTQITNETIDFGITPQEVGNNIKAVVEYVDQEIKIKIVKTTITQAQILQLFTNPITILDSSGTGSVKYPTNIYIKRLPGTAYTLADNYANIVNDLSNNIEKELMLATVLNQTTTGFSSSPIDKSQHIFYADRNSFYKLKAAVGNPTEGTGGIEVYVTYIEIDI